MSAFHPVPFGDLIKRVFHEYQQHGKIFGLSKEKFFLGFPGESFDVNYMGTLASTPFGPAAGPHTQLAQNIVLAWLTGSRIVELKTIQILDTLELPRPCIDTENIGFNVEWSQELKLEDSLKEYVKAWMLIEIIKQSELLGEDFSKHFCETIFDLSMGYDFKGIKSERIQAYIREIKNAQKTIDELREEIPEEFSEFKTLDYDPHIVDSVTLSTFHGCPADEIDLIVSHLLTEHRLNVIVKLNPTLLGLEEVTHVLHDVLGYNNLELNTEAFANDLKFDQAIEMVKSMFRTASSLGKSLGLKFTNTLVVKNNKGYLGDEAMYMSGPPLHVLALRLLKKVRSALENMHPHIPMSFSAGVDAKNFSDVVSLNLVPVTACTDLLKPFGYAKSPKYLKNLGEQMQAVEAINIPDFVMKRFGHETAAVHDIFTKLREEVQHLSVKLPEDKRTEIVSAQLEIFEHLQERLLEALKENKDSLELLTTDALIITETLKAYNQKYGQNFLLPNTFKDLYRWIMSAAATRNLESLLEETMKDPRHNYANNSKTPKKLPSLLDLYDCTSCGRCVAVCPNNANFVYHVAPINIDYVDYRVVGDDFQEIGGSRFVIEKFYQIANFADSCNECSVCATHCVEQGKPYLAKPRYFGTQEAWEASNECDGFFVEKDGEVECIAGRIKGKEYRLWHNTQTNQLTFADGIVEAVFEYPNNTPMRIISLTSEGDGHILDMKVYYILLTQLKGVLNVENVNYINIKYL